MANPVTIRPLAAENQAPYPKLAKLHITSPGAHIGGTYQTLLQTLNGWDLTIRVDLQGVLAVHNGQEFWIPFAAIRNGTLLK